MHYTSSITRIIFDPEVYMSILSEIVRITKIKSIDMYTIFLINSIYANEMLDEDIKWKDRSGEEFKQFVNKRVRMLIQVGVDLIKTSESPSLCKKTNVTFTDHSIDSVPSLPLFSSEHSSASLQAERIRFATDTERPELCEEQLVCLERRRSEEQLEEFGLMGCGTSGKSSLSDLVDSMPIDQNDEYYKKVNKLKLESQNNSKNKDNIVFK